MEDLVDQPLPVELRDELAGEALDGDQVELLPADPSGLLPLPLRRAGPRFRVRLPRRCPALPVSDLTTDRRARKDPIDPGAS